MELLNLREYAVEGDGGTSFKDACRGHNAIMMYGDGVTLLCDEVFFAKASSSAITCHSICSSCYCAASPSAMPTRLTLSLVASALLAISLLCPCASASAVFLPLRSPPALQEFGQVFALPVLNANAELSLHTVILALLPSKAAVAADDFQPALRELSSRCSIDLQHVQQQDQQSHVALCSWSASAANSHFFPLQSSGHPPSLNTSVALVVFGFRVKHIREGLTWLMRHVLLHPVGPSHGWIASPSPLEPWTSLRSTQLARSMVTMPMHLLQQ